MAKEYFCKIYNIDGYYITTWDDASFSGFTQSINGGLGETNIQLARRFDDFGEGNDVKLGNEVQVWVSDGDSGSTGRKIYSGFISRYEPYMNGHDEGVNVTCMGYVTHLNRYPLMSSTSNYSKTFTSLDCSAIMKQLIDNYRLFYAYSGGGQKSGFHRINYTESSSGSINMNTGNVISYTFANNTIYEALEKIRQFAPANWWWYIGADNLLQFKSKPNKPTHYFTLGKDFKKIVVKKNNDYMVNKVRFWNGLMSTDANYLLSTYNDATSQNAYYCWFKEETDGRVKVQATADYLGNSLISEKKDPEIRTEIEIIDNNESGLGYDIESIQVGDTCTLLGFETTSNTFEDNMQITEVRYNLDSATIVLANKQVETGRLISQIKFTLDEISKTDAGN